MHGHACVSLPSPGWTRTRVVTDSVCAQQLGAWMGASLSLDPICPAPNPDPPWAAPRVQSWQPPALTRLLCPPRMRVLGVPASAGPRWSVFLVLKRHLAHKSEAWVMACRMGGGPWGGKAALPASLGAAPTAGTVTPDSRHLHCRGLWAGLGGSFGEWEA